MWTKNKPLLSLLEWSEVIGINPYLLAQIGTPPTDLSIELGQCENVFYQGASQRSDHLSREDIALAILQAETYISQWALTYPAPKFESYTLQYPRPANLNWRQLWIGASGRLKSLETNFGNIISVGSYTEAVLQAGAAVVGSDPYSDGFNTQFTITVAVPAGTLASEVVLYFASADIPPALSQSDCEIRPIKTVISGLVATITGSMTQLVKIANYLKLVPATLNVTDAAIYATTVDVYRRTVDLNNSAALIWDLEYCPSPPCNYTYTGACFYETDKAQGYIAPVPATWDEATQQYSRVCSGRYDAPDRVVLNVVSGIPRDADGRMAQPWKLVIAYLSVGLFLQNKTCGCALADQILFALRSMPMKDDGALEISQSLFDAVSARFGVVNRGTVKAYTQVSTWDTLKIYRSAHL